MPASLILAAAGVGTAATATIVVSATTMAALTFAINFAVSALITRVFAPSKDNTQNFGTREQIPPSSDNCLPVVYGDAWLAGTFVDAVMSIDQKTMYYVVAISHISANGQITYDTTKFYYGDRLITFDGTDQTKVISLTDTAGNVDTKIGGNPGKLYINLYTSNAAGVITPVNTAQYPHQVMGGADIDAALHWPSSNRQMNGLAFAIIKLNYNSADGFTNLQPLTFKLSHTLNGTGFAKPGDVLYDYLTNEYYGGAVPAANVDATGCTALNVYSDQTITYTPYGGGASTQARYRINGVLNTGDTVLNNINHILTACDSWLSYDAAAGQWSPVINKAEGSSFLFDDSNIVGEIKVSVTDLSSTYNQIEVSFPFKDNKDQAEYVRLETPDGLLYPNEPVNKLSTTFNLVNDSVQAEYLANRVLEQAREDLIVSFASAYPGIQINAGDVVGVTNVEYGWSNKLFRVMKVAESSLPDGNLGARFDLSEYNAQVYDDKDITQFTPVPNSGLPAPQYFGTLTAPFVSASRPDDASPSFDVSVTTATGGRIAYINLFFTTIPTPVAGDWILYSSYNRSDADVIPVSSAFSMTNIVLGEGTYYFAVVYGNESAESPLSPISSAFVWAPAKAVAPSVDISGFTGFSRSITGVFTPASALLTADILNIDSPTYLWAVTGATPASGTASTITITPTVGAASIIVDLTVDGSNLPSPLSRSITLPIVDDGATGATGPTGPQGDTGETGPRNAQVFFYYNTATSSAPTAPTTAEVSYNFSTQTASISASGWSTLFNPSGQSTTTAENKWWAVKVVFQELTYGGAYSETISSVFTWQNLDGLVTFTNLSTAQGPLGTGTTFIDGGSIVTNTIVVGKLTSGSTNVGLTGTFGLGDVTTPVIAGAVATVYGKNAYREQWGGAFVNTNTTADPTGTGAYYYYNGLLGATQNPYGVGLGAYNQASSSPLSMRSFFVAGEQSATAYGGFFKTNSYSTANWSVANRLAYMCGEVYLGVKDQAGYFTYFGDPTAAYNRTDQNWGAQGIVAGQYGSIFTQRNAAPSVTLRSQVYIAPASFNYAIYVTPSLTYDNAYIPGGVTPFTGAHEGLSSTSFEIGDIVIDDQLVKRIDISNAIFTQKLSTLANEKGVIGVVSRVRLLEDEVNSEQENLRQYEQQVPENGGIANGFAKKDTGAQPPSTFWSDLNSSEEYIVLFNAVGEGLINVCGENGDIEKGDLIVSSSIPGKGMKQADDIVRGYTVAKARESVTFSSASEVKLIACIYLCG